MPMLGGVRADKPDPVFLGERAMAWLPTVGDQFEFESKIYRLIRTWTKFDKANSPYLVAVVQADPTVSPSVD